MNLTFIMFQQNSLRVITLSIGPINGQYGLELQYEKPFNTAPVNMNGIAAI